MRDFYRRPELAVPLSLLVWLVVLVWVWEVSLLGGSANALSWFR